MSNMKYLILPNDTKTKEDNTADEEYIRYEFPVHKYWQYRFSILNF